MLCRRNFMSLILILALSGCGRSTPKEGVSRSTGESVSSIPEEKRQASFRDLGLALHNYEQMGNGLPRADGPGTPMNKFQSNKYKPGLSWRVYLLPVLSRQDLFAKFKLDEPWDSPANSALLPEMPEIFRSAGTSKPGETCFHVLLGPKGKKGFIFTDPLAKAPPSEPDSTEFVSDGILSTRLAEISDGLADTIMLVEGGPSTAAPWTQPGGIVVDVTHPKAALGISGQHALMMAANGKFHKVDFAKMSDETFLALLTRNNKANEPAVTDW
jgi:hypothetical protein